MGAGSFTCEQGTFYRLLYNRRFCRRLFAKLYIWQESDMNYTYMVRCSDGSLYTGWTNDLEKGCGLTMRAGEPDIRRAGFRLHWSITRFLRQRRSNAQRVRHQTDDPRTETGIACRTFTIIYFSIPLGGHPFVKGMFYFADFRDIIRCFDQIGTGSLTG